MILDDQCLLFPKYFVYLDIEKKWNTSTSKIQISAFLRFNLAWFATKTNKSPMIKKDIYFN